MNYCSSCGLESTPGLNYCKRCGGILNTQALQSTPSVSVAKPAWAISTTVTLTSITAFIIYFLFLSHVLEIGRPISQEMLALLGLMVFTVVLIVDVMLIRLLSRLINHSLETPKLPQIKPAVKAIDPVHSPLLTEPPISSVVDSTTQLFDQPIREPIKRKTT